MTPWPKKLEDLEDRQTDAEHWAQHSHEINPLTLDLETTTDLERGYWPDAFAKIPIFRKSMPRNRSFDPPSNTDAMDIDKAPSAQSRLPLSSKDLDPKAAETTTTYFRGLAPSLDLNSPPSTTSTSHPYLSPRIAGFTHPIAPSTTHALPFHRIAFILYRPSAASLASTLEDALHLYGGPTQQAALADLYSGWLAAQGLGPASAGPHVSSWLPPAAGSVEFQEALVGVVRRELDEVGRVGPVEMGTEAVRAMEWCASYGMGLLEFGEHERAVEKGEKGVATAGAVGWEEVEAAWAYEGAVLPGGKIMLGRWWRVGEGREGGGGGDEDVEVELEGKGEQWEVGNGTERGAWCFWSP